LRRITDTDVVAYGLGLGRERSFPADTVCIVTFHDLNDDLAAHLRAEHADAGFGVHVIGNADGGDSIQAAIRSAAELTRTL
jgi:hypothetical protein